MDSDPKIAADRRKEAELAHQTRTGDLSAFENLCRRLQQPLYRYVHRLVGAHADTEDICQETLYRLYRSLLDGTYRREGSTPRGFVFCIAHNLSMSFHRSKKNVVPLNDRHEAGGGLGVEQTLLREQIELALDDLPERHRSALMLREFGDLSYTEIGHALDASVGDVKNWIFRGRKRLGQLLDRDGQYLGAKRHEV